LTLLKCFAPLVLNVPVRITKEGYKVETRTVMFRREFHITGTAGAREASGRNEY